MGTTSDGYAYLCIRLSGSDNVKVCTWDNGISDIGAETLIRQDNPLYQELSEHATGDVVTFSGQFLIGLGSRDYPTEKSVTEEGSMTDPDYLMRFSEIHPNR